MFKSKKVLFKIIYSFVAVLLVAAVMLSGCNAADATTKNGQEDINITIGHVSTAGNHFGWQDMGTYLYHATVYQESLIGMDENGNFIPRLAESWETTDSKIWTFHLVQNATWHDGTPFTAQDVLFTIRYTLEKKPWGMNDAKFMEQIENYYAPDDYTVVLEMDSPFANLLNNLRIGLVVVPEHIYKDVDDPMLYGNLDTEINATIGTGPFKVASLDTTARTLKFIANDDYYGGKPSIDSITIKYYDTTDAMVLALLKGDIDTTFGWGAGIDYYNVPKILNSDNIDIALNPSFALNTLAFNNAKAPFDNLKLRQAVAYCLDYTKLTNLVQGGYGDVANTGLIPLSMPNSIETPALVMDTNKAKQLLDELGYVDINEDGWRESPDGSAFTPELLTSASGWRGTSAEIITGNLHDVGINVQVNVSASFGSERQKRTYDMVLSGVSSAGMFAWESYYTTDIDGNGGLGNAQVFDPDFLALVQDLREATPAEMPAAAKAIQEYYSENLPAVALYWAQIIQPYNNTYTGWGYDPGFGTVMCYDTFFNLAIAD
jgi:peptide/nickel transport system substrate-binding protein